MDCERSFIMICPNCSTENPVGSFCKNCGTRLSNAVPSAVTAKNKGDYIKNFASDKCRRNALISLILTLVLIVSMVGSYFIVMGTSVEKIPLISFAAKMSDEDAVEEIGEYKREMKDKVLQGRIELANSKQKFTQEEYSLLEKLFDTTELCSESCSIRNFKKFYKVAEQITEKANLAQKVDIAKNTINDISDIKEILNIVSVVLVCCVLFVLFFSALGGLLKVRFLVILGMLFALIYALILCPVWVLVLIMIMYIALIVFISMVNSEYKAYKRNIVSNR